MAKDMSPTTTKLRFGPPRRLTWRQVMYELRNLLGNWFIPFFGLAFPALLSQILARTALADVPAAMRMIVITGLALTMLQIIPISVTFLGHSATFSEELERRVPLRMQLFGFRTGQQLLAKMIAQILFMTFSLVVNTVIMVATLDILTPTAGGMVIYFATLYLLGVALFMLAHGIANFVRRFGPAYAISMVCYFIFMFFGGMMGPRPGQLTGVLRRISNLLPFAYLSEDFIDVWQGKAYDFSSFIQAMILFFAIAAIVMLASFVYRRHRAF